MTLQYEVTIVGAVDPDRDEKRAGDFNGMPSTYDESKDIARSNMRFRAVMDQISLLASFDIININVTGRTKDDAATSIKFTLIYKNGLNSYLRIEDSANPGQYLTGPAAIKRAIAVALSTDYIQNYSFWDPEVRVTRTNTNTTRQNTPPRGWCFEMVDATKLYSDVAAAESNITITQL